MPTAALRPCTHPGCGVLVVGGRCALHERARQHDVDARRESSTKRGYTSRWQKARATFLREHPLCQCEECQEGKLRVRAAITVDHIVPHRGDQQLFWDTNNWQSMAKTCHDKKTAREDGGFGNRRGDVIP